MKFNPDEKYGIVVSLISANIFLFLTKITYFGLLEKGVSLNMECGVQAFICYAFFGVTISSLYTPVYILWIAIRRKRSDTDEYYK